MQNFIELLVRNLVSVVWIKWKMVKIELVIVMRNWLLEWLSNEIGFTLLMVSKLHD